MRDPAQECRELLALIDIDATPILTVLSLAQRELPAALAVCGGNLTDARFRFAASRSAELAHCGATLNSRDVNRAALRKQGVAPALIDAFLGASAQPRYPGEPDPYLSVLRIDWAEVSALVNAHNQSCVLTAPDVLLIDSELPEPAALQPHLPRTPRPAPSHLQLSVAADLPAQADGSALRSLVLTMSSPIGGLRALLESAHDLSRLVIGDAALLDSGVFDGLALAALQQLQVHGAQNLTRGGWERASQWRAVRALQLDGLGMNGSNLDLLAAIADAPFWSKLTHLNLQLFTRQSALDPTLWTSLWAGREFALQTLQLRYLDAPTLAAVWQGRFPELRTLDVGGNDLRAHLGDALKDADLPLLQALDVRGNGLTPTAVRAFALSHGFRSLRQIAVDLASSVLEDYSDWNGAKVGEGFVPMATSEIERHWLVGSGLRCWSGIDKNA